MSKVTAPAVSQLAGEIAAKVYCDWCHDEIHPSTFVWHVDGKTFDTEHCKEQSALGESK